MKKQIIFVFLSALLMVQIVKSQNNYYSHLLKVVDSETKNSSNYNTCLELNKNKIWTMSEAISIVKLIYINILGRPTPMPGCSKDIDPVDEDGRKSWIIPLTEGKITVRGVVEGVGKSPEYVEKFVTKYAIAKNVDLIIETMFNKFLNRLSNQGSDITDNKNSFDKYGWYYLISDIMVHEYYTRFGDDGLPNWEAGIGK
jgi:hypothetical protein